MNAESLREAITTKELAFFKTNQKNSNNINYFFTPTISINLYKCKVIYRTNKNITIQFDKILNKSLYLMLSSMHNQLSAFVNINTDNKKFYPIVYETDTKFSIQCYLPHKIDKYFISCTFDKEECAFTLPNINSYLDMVNIEIRNIWETKDKIGYNIEIKKIDY